MTSHYAAYCDEEAGHDPTNHQTQPFVYNRDCSCMAGSYSAIVICARFH